LRDPKRIDKFCDEFKSIWKGNVPDWRFGQLISNFEYWLKGKVIDMFFPEEKEMLRLFKEFLGVNDTGNEKKIWDEMMFCSPLDFKDLDGNKYDQWPEGVIYTPGIKLTGILKKKARTNYCGVTTKDAKKIIDNISDKRKQNVKVVIGNRAEVCDAILYIIKSNYGLIVSVDDAEEIKFCEELFEKVTT
jgi:hypothetical protein